MIEIYHLTNVTLSLHCQDISKPKLQLNQSSSMVVISPTT